MTALTILVADDDAPSLEVIAMFLEMEGHRVVTATDGLRAWDLACTHAPDLIILDSSMPGLSGAEVARRVRADDRLRGCRLVALSGRDACDAEDPHLFDRYLTKPVSPPDLLSVTR
ncbi:response regulator [Chiayiivirga flava]|uniref:CheY-like chemotaxis protein n=1 Tax=Chiayiivirga flava TaxID=659595 RepID=A0A7W8FZC6_9GAMM|nr:response regulator [Chiayiivirga flava]MBB5206498.1 CheY-like chemotaxis protein [Chiayiivirga flava]